MEVFSTAIPLILKSLWLSAKWAGIARVKALKAVIADGDEIAAEILHLRDRVAQLEPELDLIRRQAVKAGRKSRYTLKERLLVLWYLEYFQVPKRQVKKKLGVARSTLYRWLKRVDEGGGTGEAPPNKTPKEVVGLVWVIAKANPHWGRIRISMQLALLNIFLAASTVRNILNRPQPAGPTVPICSQTSKPKDLADRVIPAWYPNHVWSVDRTIVYRWSFWPTQVLLAIDHFSRKIVCVAPLEGANAGWSIDRLEQAFHKPGAPKHVVTDQESVFTGAAFAESLRNWKVKHRFGAIGKHGSIAVTERAFKTLKHEWLNRVPILKGFDHLAELCDSFEEWYNEWRPHMKLDGAAPSEVFSSKERHELSRFAKTVPSAIECRVFPETRVTGYRLKKVA
jgi:transposase InsO family protein